jgi:hypothetical protein
MVAIDRNWGRPGTSDHRLRLPVCAAGMDRRRPQIPKGIALRVSVSTASPIAVRTRTLPSNPMALTAPRKCGTVTCEGAGAPTGRLMVAATTSRVPDKRPGERVLAIGELVLAIAWLVALLVVISGIWTPVG